MQNENTAKLTTKAVAGLPTGDKEDKEITVKDIMEYVDINHTATYNVLRIPTATGLLKHVYHGVYVCGTKK